MRRSLMASDRENKAKKSVRMILLLLVGGGVLGMILSLGIAEMVHVTSTDKFCTVCHTMQPMADSYHADIHGGNNSKGLKATCVACHLPHDTMVNYMWQKVGISLHDVRVQVLSDTSKIDWNAKRKHAKTFVYDSGCVSCHTNLQEATMRDPKAFIAHKEYFEGRTDKTCVECHANVGHHVLGDYLKK